MTRVCFITGAEDSRDYPSDTPEAYWRTYLPGRIFGTAVVLGRKGAPERALEAEVLWICGPTCLAAANLAETAAQMGKPVVVDFAEDPWSRHEIDGAYNQVRLEAVERALAVATAIVVATPGLAPVFARYGRVREVPTFVPATLAPADPSSPQTLGWWCDGRQKGGLEAVAPALGRMLEEPEIRMAHIGFAHQAPLMKGVVGKDAIAERTSRLCSFFPDDLHLSLEANLRILSGALATCALSLECYPAGQYRETVSDIPILRAAALGVPTITTRREAPPGAIAAQPDQWADVILAVLADPGSRRALSLEARTWAQSRTSHQAHKAVLEEVR